MTNPRYDIVELKKAKKGFKAVVVDNRHPSGVKGIAVRWFDTVAMAKAHLDEVRATYKIIQQI